MSHHSWKSAAGAFLRPILIILGLTASLPAAFLRNMPQTLSQPDGMVLNCFASGDEFNNWLHDKDDYTILPDPMTGFYVYAMLDSMGELVPSPFIVGRIDPKLLGIQKGLRRSAQWIEKRRAASRGREAASIAVPTPRTGTLNNLIIFIRFSDEAEFTDNISAYDTSLNTSTTSMRSYYTEASYNALTINTLFYPDRPGSTVVSYQDSHPRQYYKVYNAATAPLGYTNDTDARLREHTLLGNAVNAVSAQILADGLNVDADNDGYVDNVCFVIDGAGEGWADLLWPHMWSLYSGAYYIGTKRVYVYNFQLSAWLSVGVLCHEMGHSLGAPDFYRYYNNTITPVASWDTMSWQTNPAQHMTAFTKFKYMTWIAAIPEITTSGTYTLNPMTSSSGNCYKIKSPNSTTQYFVVEYRRKTGLFESNLPGEGLLVYRINTAATGNANGPPDELYVYRPNGTLSVDGSYNSAPYSSNAGRMTINDSTNPSSFLSTGGPGGLNISNVGAIGTTISFTVTISGTGGDPYEPNDSRATAKSVTLSGTPPTWTSSGAVVSPATDQDWYKFTAAAGEVYTFTCHPTSSLDAKIVVYLGDSLKASRDASGSGGDEVLSYQCLESGTYYVGVGYYAGISGTVGAAESADDPQPADTGGYNLTVTRSAVVSDPYESNNTRAAAFQVSLSGSPWTTSGARIVPLTDQDWFKFSALTGDALTLTCHPLSGLDAKIVLYFGDTLKASRDVAGGGGDEVLSYTCADSGTFYIGVGYYSSISGEVSARSGSVGILSDTGDYALTIQKASTGKDDLLGIWTGQGVYYRNSDSGRWVLLETSAASQVTAGDLDGDGIDDLIATFPSDPGVWTKRSSTGTWQKLDTLTPNWIAAADMNGDGRVDFVGAWNNGVYYRNSLTGMWVLIETSSASKIAAADIDGDGKADLIGTFVSDPGLWVKRSSTGTWLKLDSLTPIWIATGDMNGDGRQDVVGIWTSAGIYYRNSISGTWVLKETAAASKIAAGDLDGDGTDDLIGTFDSDPGVLVKKSTTNSWVKLDTATPAWISAGRMRAPGVLNLPGESLFRAAGGAMSLSFRVADSDDLSSYGPHGLRLTWTGDGNVKSTRRTEPTSRDLTIPGPGEPGFKPLLKERLASSAIKN